MGNIQMVDLSSLHQRIGEEIHESIRKVFENSAFINGEEVRKFQGALEKYLNVRHVIPCASGTDALKLAFMASDLKPGDEVIIPAFTFISAAEAAAMLGLTPVFADVENDTFNVSVETIEKVLTTRTKAIVPTHLFGQCSDMAPIMELARRNHLLVIEDACQSLGADYIQETRENHLDKNPKFPNALHTSINGNPGKTYTGKGSAQGMETSPMSIKAGTLGDFGCTSFFPSKNLGCCGDGGAIFTNNDLLANKARILANHGSEKKYNHTHIGLNSRLDNIQAAILNIKLPLLDTFNQRRQQAARQYDEILKGVPQLKIPSRKTYSTHIFHQYSLVCPSQDSRDHLQMYLKNLGIPSMIYYPVPLHLQKCFSYLGYREGDFPVSEQLCQRILSIPMHTELRNEQIEEIGSAILKFFN